MAFFLLGNRSSEDRNAAKNAENVDNLLSDLDMLCKTGKSQKKFY